MNIAVLGGGIAGLTAAYELVKKGHEVLVIEKRGKLGGKLRSVNIGETPLEEFYHHVFPHNEVLFSLLKELDLYNKLEEVQGTTGFLYKDELYELSGPLSLLLYKPLSLIDRLKLGFFIIKVRSIKDPSEFVGRPLKQWIVRNTSKTIYKNFFKPLLKGKYGSKFEEVSVPWFIKRIQLRSNRGHNGEELLYMRGAFKQLIERLRKEIESSGGEVLLNTTPKKIGTKGDRVSYLDYGSGEEMIDGLISTIPPGNLNSLLGKDILIEREYQGAICVVLGLKKSLCDYYWTNIIRDDISFGAYIEHTQIQPKPLYGNQVVSYLASYPEFSLDIWEKKDKKVFERYFQDLKKLFDIKKEDINFWKVFRTQKAGIVYKRGIGPEIIKCKTEIPNLFVGGMFNSYPGRSINLSVKLGKRSSRLLQEKGKV